MSAAIWAYPVPQGSPAIGAQIQSITYGNIDRTDAAGDAGNVTDKFLNGTVMTSPAEAVVQVTNAFLGTTVTLDMSDRWHPRRTGEHGDVEQAGWHNEVWLDFDWKGPSEGDVCRPFTTVPAAVAAVASGGVIRIVPGTTTDRSTISGKKPLRLVAPIGGVVIGARDGAKRQPIAGTTDPAEDVRKDDVWVQFDFPESEAGNVPGPFNSLSKAMDAVADGGVIRIVPGSTPDRPKFGNGKRFRIVAPIGGVTIGSPTPQPPSQAWVKFGSTIGGKPVRLVAPDGGVTIGAQA